MAEIPLENMLDKSSGSIYDLAVLAAKRALELAEGQPRLVNIDSTTKPSLIAMAEIAAGKIIAKKQK